MPIGDNLPVELQGCIEKGILKGAFERRLSGKRAYTMAAIPETIRARKGATLTLTRPSGLAPKTAPINQAAKKSNLDNGLTSDQFSVEQYTLTMEEYMATADLGLLDDEAMIVGEAMHIAEAQGEQAMNTLEILARTALINAGIAGNSRVIDSGSESGHTPGTTSCQVDDIRGFQYVLVNGVKTAVSGTNKLAVQETANGGGGVTQTLQVTGVVANVTNKSSAAAVGGISGVITFDSATAPVAGDILVASNATEMVRPNGKQATHLLTGQDVFSTAAAFDMSVVLENNGVPRFGDYYFCFVSPKSHRQLFADASFEKAYESQYNSDPMRKGVITEHQGIMYVKTNFALRQAAGNGVAVNVERPIMVGKDALIRGDYEGLENFAKKQAKSKIHSMNFIDGVLFNIRDALDRAGQYVAMTWQTIIDFQCPTDKGTTQAIVPTANNALYKRICMCEHAG